MTVRTSVLWKMNIHMAKKAINDGTKVVYKGTFVSIQTFLETWNENSSFLVFRIKKNKFTFCYCLMILFRGLLTFNSLLSKWLYCVLTAPMLVLLKKGNKTENRSNLFFGFWQNFAKWSSHSRVSDNECKVRDKTDTA